MSSVLVKYCSCLFIGDAIGPNGNISQRDISREPMSIVLNLGFSTSWTYIDWSLLGWVIHRSEGPSRAQDTDTSVRPKLEEGVTMYIDYVRIYQEEGKESVTCDPREFSPVFFSFSTLF